MTSKLHSLEGATKNNWLPVSFTSSFIQPLWLTYLFLLKFEKNKVVVWFIIYSRTHLYFNITEISFVMKQENLQRQSCYYKYTATAKVARNSRRLMQEFSQYDWFRTSLDRLIQRNDIHGRTNRRPGSGSPKSVSTTDSIAVVWTVWGLICSIVGAEILRHILCGAYYHSTFQLRCRVFAISCRLCDPKIIRFG